ncbi:hypothetical protein F2P44_21590 [Massilia sp. CCM 8695]|uniref:Uncharacterized protein n=1 Tax=Massilia frigida TaxID=2609281 RepID=A0ABX0N9L7_9BURK|nr:hypothetical protein [Massilia frigida]NHZ81849.1 hypothetical protein [Massilia frigida]
MSSKFFIDLGHVIDLEGEKIAVSIQTQMWGDEIEYGVAFNELNNPNELFHFGSLFDFLLKGEEKDFEIISETRLCEPDRIPAEQIRSLVRRILKPHELWGQVFTVQWNGTMVRQQWRLMPVDETPPF